MVRAGQLRKLITIEQPTEGAADAYGERAKTWSTLAQVWAGVEPLSGREAWQAKAAQSDVTHKITLRYRGDVTPACRVVYGTRVFELRSVRNLEERNEVLECEAVERV